MMYQVVFTQNGHEMATPPISEEHKNLFIEGLGLKENEYHLVERPGEKLWHCPMCVFDLQLIDAAKKAIKKGEDMDGIYTFGDEKCIAKEDHVVKVECMDIHTNKLTVKYAYVVHVWKATAQEIRDFKARKNIKKIRLVVGTV